MTTNGVAMLMMIIAIVEIIRTVYSQRVQEPPEYGPEPGSLGSQSPLVWRALNYGGS